MHVWEDVSAVHAACTVCTRLPACSLAIEELTLKSNATTELRILFDDAWLVQVGLWQGPSLLGSSSATSIT